MIHVHVCYGDDVCAMVMYAIVGHIVLVMTFLGCSILIFSVVTMAISLHSYNACCEFLQRNSLLSIIRAHEAQDAG